RWRLSYTTTSFASRSRWTRCDPMNPAPPVMQTRFPDTVTIGLLCDGSLRASTTHAEPAQHADPRYSASSASSARGVGDVIRDRRSTRRHFRWLSYAWT